MKNSKKPNNHQEAKAIFTTIPLKCFYEKWSCVFANEFTIYLNCLVLLFILSGTIPALAQTALRGGKQTVPLTQPGGANQEGTAWLVNNTTQEIAGLRFLNINAKKLKSIQISHHDKTETENLHENKSVYVKFSKAIKPGEVMLVKATFGAITDALCIIPLNKRGAELMIDQNVNRNIEQFKKEISAEPTKLTGGLQTIAMDASTFASLNFTNETGQNLCEIWIKGTTTNSKILKPHSVYINDIPVNTSISRNGIHVCFPCVPNGCKFNFSLKIHGSSELSSFDVMSKKNAGKASGSVTNLLENWKNYTIIVTPASCNSVSNGSASLISNRNSAPFITEWSNGSTQQSLRNVPAGVYQVKITSPDGCIFKNITIPALKPSLTILPLPATCFATNDGAAIAITHDFIEPLTFSWSNGHTLQTATGLNSGTQQVKVIDAVGCKESARVNITRIQPITVTGFVNSVTCAGLKNASISITGNGGFGGYSFIWNNGLTCENLSNVASGNYTVTITDGTGCSSSSSFFITEPPALKLMLNEETTGCEGSLIGKISATATGGTPPYQFTWSNGAAGNPATGLSAGKYTVTVTDAGGCAKSQSTVLSETPPLTVSVTQSGPDVAMATPTGGVPPFTFSWNTVPVQTTPTATGLLPGQTYFVQVKDKKSCIKTVTFVKGALRWYKIENENELNVQVFPNPASSIVNIQILQAGNNYCSYELRDAAGRMVLKSSENRIASALNQFDVSGLKAGIYSLKVIYQNSFKMIKVIISKP